MPTKLYTVQRFSTVLTTDCEVNLFKSNFDRKQGQNESTAVIRVQSKKNSSRRNLGVCTRPFDRFIPQPT